MLRNLLLLVLAILIARAVLRVVDGLTRGARRASPAERNGPGAAPSRGVPMARDPVCGTFVVPGRAVALAEGSRQTYFCSTRCRDRYRSRSSTGSDQSGHVEGRTA
jgi:hypothetical protein